MAFISCEKPRFNIDFAIMIVSVYRGRKSASDRPTFCRKVISRLKKLLRRAIMIRDEFDLMMSHSLVCVRR